MNHHTKPRTGLWILAYMIIFSFSQQAAFLLIINYTMNKNHIVFEQASQLVYANQTPLVLAMSALIGLPLLFLMIRWRRLSWSDMVFEKKVRLKQLLGLFAVGIVLNILAGWFLNFLQMIPGSSSLFEAYQQSMVGMSPQSDPRQLILLLGIVVPIYEEVLFRGLVFREFAAVIPVRWAIFAQALLFGVWHTTLIQGVYAFVLALFLGRLYLRYHSIWATCAIHCGFNTAAFLWIYFFKI